MFRFFAGVFDAIRRPDQIEKSPEGRFESVILIDDKFEDDVISSGHNIRHNLATFNCLFQTVHHHK